MAMMDRCISIRGHVNFDFVFYGVIKIFEINLMGSYENLSHKDTGSSQKILSRRRGHLKFDAASIRGHKEIKVIMARAQLNFFGYILIGYLSNECNDPTLL